MHALPALAAHFAAKGPIRPCPVGKSRFRLRPLCDARTPGVRGIRVTMLLAATCVMCLADLWMTILYATSIGMIENNPLARAVMEHNCPQILAGWKIATMLLSNGILFWARRLKYAEVATWVCFLTMAGLSVHWLNYASEVSSYTAEFSMMAMVEDPRWVNMNP